LRQALTGDLRFESPLHEVNACFQLQLHYHRRPVQLESLSDLPKDTAQLAMSQFRAKKLDLSGFVNVRILRDHTKRKVFAQHEQERYDIKQ
jgi:hypothetical protein